MSDVQFNRCFMPFCYAIVGGHQFEVIENPMIPASTMNPGMEICEQPTPTFRFRYKSETGKHGSLMGISSNKKTKTFPKIKIRDCIGKVRIQARLTYYEDDTRPPIWHVHKLSGKNCNEDGVYETVHNVTADNNIIQLSNVYISHIAKRAVVDTLYERYSRDHSHERAEKLSKDFGKILEAKLNEVRIEFQAELYVKLSDSYVQLCPPVYSQKIFNTKSPAARDLKISRISRCSGLATGGEEVFLLCEPVDKKNIKVKFYKLNENNDEEWAADGEFNPADVHHKVAIVFKTPPYQDVNIETEVEVFLQLYRPNDDNEGEPLKFTYTPTELDQQRKKAKLLDCAASQGKTTHPNLPVHQRQRIAARRNVNLRVPKMEETSATCINVDESVPQTADIIEQYSQYDVNHQSQAVLPTIAEIQDDLVQSTSPVLPIPDVDILQSVLDEVNILEYQMDVVPAEQVNVENNSQSSYYEDSTQTGSSFNSQSNSQYAGVLQTDNDPLLPGLDANDDDFDFASSGVHWPDIANMLNMEPRGFPSAYGVFEDGELTVDGDLAVDGAVCSEGKASEIEKKIKAMGSQDRRSVFQLAVKIANSLLDFARFDDIKCVLKPMAELISFSDTSGDNAIHLAVIHSKLGALKVLLETTQFCNPKSRREIMNALNNLMQSPLHIAVCNGDLEFVELLLCYDADPNVRDKRGNNAVHVAVQGKKFEILPVLLEKKVDLDVLNNEGYSPLHLAILTNSIESTALLLDAGANIDRQDGKAGRTPLHMAVQDFNIPLVKYLLDEKADSDMKMFSGNSSLHMAVRIESEEIVALLMKAYADPYLQTDDISLSPDTSDDDINVDEDSSVEPRQPSDGMNCFDMAKGNEKILAILHGIEPEVELEPEVEFIPVKSIMELKGGLDSGYGGDSVPSIPKCDTWGVTLHDQDSGMGLSTSDEVEETFLRHDNIDSGLSLCTSEIGIVDGETTISLSRLLDPPSDKDWRNLIMCLGKDELIEKLRSLPSPTTSLLTHVDSVDKLECALEALGSDDCLKIVRKYRYKKDCGEKQHHLSNMMGQLKIKH